MTDSKKLEEILKYLQMNPNQFAKSLNRSVAGIYNVLTGKGGRVGLSKSLANDIIKKYPQFNLSWLLTGEGERLRETVTVQQIPTKITEIISYRELFKDEKKENAELRERIGELKNEIKNLTERINALQNDLECRKKENLELRGNINSQPNPSENMPELPEVPAQLAAESADKRRRNVLK
jgi:flagellar capping protein FliD